ncbi:probable enoyl-CoA hydratase echA14 isoform X2 [Oryzias melastigma]|uniref:probable enoyl-CoA hydratase echA14 isoform X2 n=1 Tax=Oryzias melastigma TaxID=30732 RepID=UPI000CF81A16|nr:probable enoyl-CoA hydratase echA14 isoform X2 [Oryzias melastigma]
MAVRHVRPFGLILRAALHDKTAIRIKKNTRFTSVKSYSTSTGGEGAQTAAGQTVVSERRGPVVIVEINRPEVRNAVNQETAGRLLEELQAFDRDPELKVAVLHGKGGNFCAGYDLKMLANEKAPLKLEQDVRKDPGPMGPSRLQLSKPLIAAVSGFAVAGGLELALLADLRVVEESAIMGVFCRRFALQASLQLAEEISSFPQRCLRADRSSAMHSCFDASSFTQALQHEFDHGVPVIQEEAIRGATKFVGGEGRGGKFSSD